ncbi:MAG: hypothetical protein LAO78_05415 [Acidobacteriia bacterium]|nr:hypothetical protein [Terriglobia bacterium]
MAVLDCESYESSIRSICDIYRTTPDQIIGFLSAIDLDKETATSKSVDEYLRSVFEIQFGQPVEPLNSTSWFHFTRVLPNASFSEGILPLPLAKGRVWEALVTIPSDPQIKRNLKDLKENGVPDYQYNQKASHSLDDGPFGMLIRELAFHAEAIGNVDYLKLPELVDDICKGYKSKYGKSIRNEISHGLRKCIVKFKSTERTEDGLIAPALYYSWVKANDKKFDDVDRSAVAYSFNGSGATIPFEAIQRIEFV